MKHLTSASLFIAHVLVFASCKKDIDKEFQQPEITAAAHIGTKDRPHSTLFDFACN